MIFDIADEAKPLMPYLAWARRNAPPLAARSPLRAQFGFGKGLRGASVASTRHQGSRIGTKLSTRSVAQMVILFVLNPWAALANTWTPVHDMSGGVHDFTSDLPNSSDATGSPDKRRDRCHACHMPPTDDPADYGKTGIRWNATASTRTNWQMYASDPTMLDWVDGNVEPAPTGSSKVCLSCHDGVTAGNQSDGRSTGTAGVETRMRVAIGRTSGGLTNNHPISITYAWTRDSQLRNPVFAIMGDGRSVADLLENGRVECATCHDVHTRDADSNRAMLRIANTGADASGSGASDLCLVCHDK